MSLPMELIDQLNVKKDKEQQKKMVKDYPSEKFS